MTRRMDDPTTIAEWTALTHNLRLVAGRCGSLERQTLVLRASSVIDALLAERAELVRVLTEKRDEALTWRPDSYTGGYRVAIDFAIALLTGQP